MIMMLENTLPDPEIPDVRVRKGDIPDNCKITRMKTAGWNVIIAFGPRFTVPEFGDRVNRRRKRRHSHFQPDIAIFRKKTGKLLALARLAVPNCHFRSDRQIDRYLAFNVPVYVSDGFGPIEKIAKLAVKYHRVKPAIPGSRRVNRK